MAENSPAIASIFISYAHVDEDLKKELDKYLKVLKRSSKIESWNDRDLIPGQEWDAEIMAALDKANIILLLIISVVVLGVCFLILLAIFIYFTNLQ